MKKEINYVEISKQTACGHCRPDEFEVPDLKGYVCRCECHKEKQHEDVLDRFDKEFAPIPNNDCGTLEPMREWILKYNNQIKTFLSKELQQAKEQGRQEMRDEIKERIIQCDNEE